MWSLIFLQLYWSKTFWRTSGFSRICKNLNWQYSTINIQTKVLCGSILKVVLAYYKLFLCQKQCLFLSIWLLIFLSSSFKVYGCYWFRGYRRFIVLKVYFLLIFLLWLLLLRGNSLFRNLYFRLRFWIDVFSAALHY